LVRLVDRPAAQKVRAVQKSGAAANHAFLASAYGLKGEPDLAAAELAEARRLFGDNRFSSVARLRTIENWGVPKIRALVEATYFAGLRKAGMPEE
jgi:hypothetical protein